MCRITNFHHIIIQNKYIHIVQLTYVHLIDTYHCINTIHDILYKNESTLQNDDDDDDGTSPFFYSPLRLDYDPVICVLAI